MGVDSGLIINSPSAEVARKVELMYLRTVRLSLENQKITTENKQLRKCISFLLGKPQEDVPLKPLAEIINLESNDSKQL
jgi:hypothetical protein